MPVADSSARCRRHRPGRSSWPDQEHDRRNCAPACPVTVLPSSASDRAAHTAALVAADIRALLATITVAADADGYTAGCGPGRSRAPAVTAPAWPATSPTPPGTTDVETFTVLSTLRALARRIRGLETEAAAHERAMRVIVRSWRRTCSTCVGRPDQLRGRAQPCTPSPCLGCATTPTPAPMRRAAGPRARPIQRSSATSPASSTSQHENPPTSAACTA